MVSGSMSHTKVTPPWLSPASQASTAAFDGRQLSNHAPLTGLMSTRHMQGCACSHQTHSAFFAGAEPLADVTLLRTVCIP